MKFLYIANIRLPTEKAHGAQIMKTCEALARVDSLEALLVTDRKNAIKDDPFQYYAVQTRFPLERIHVLDTVGWGKFGFLLETISFVLSSLSVLKKYPETILYGRDEVVLWLISFFTKKGIVWESHTGAWNAAARSLCKRAQRLVVITQGLKDWYIWKGIPAEKIIVAPDGIDLASFENTGTPAQAHARLNLPDAFIAMYVGRLDGWKGADTVLEASEHVPENIRIVVIGGEPAQVQSMRKSFPKVHFVGSRPYAELPSNLPAADVLLLPTSSKNIIGAQFTSPMKLFGYLAAGKPIIATDIPSHREVLDTSEACFVAPDDSIALANVIKDTANLEPEARNLLAKAARQKAQKYTWDARARILQKLLRV